MHVEAKLKALGLRLPAPARIPQGVQLPFALVRTRGNRAYVSGHRPRTPTAPLRGRSALSEPRYPWRRAISLLGSLPYRC